MLNCICISVYPAVNKTLFKNLTYEGEKMLKDFDLTGKKAIVTGAASGLSLAMAEALHEHGAEIVIMDLSDQGESAASQLSSSGAKAHFVKVNLADRKDLTDKFFEALKILGGEIDILVNGAGVQVSHASEDFTMEEWDFVLNVNLHAPFFLCRLAGREMLKKGKGKIINIASMASFFGGVKVPAYAASKGGVAQLTKALCNEWASRGINVNAIAPGYMETPLNAHITPDTNPERYEHYRTRTPAGRWGIPSDMKGLTVFLASDACDFINGAIIPCDGGYLVR